MARIMARRLKTYETSSGFYDVAVAAPSMKAAAEAWGWGINVFKQGFARETRDPAIVAATLAKPGVVLRRAVGSNGPFSEHAKLPKDLPVQKDEARGTKPEKKAPVDRNIDSTTAEAAAATSEKEQKRREKRVGEKRLRGRRIANGANRQSRRQQGL